MAIGWSQFGREGTTGVKNSTGKSLLFFGEDWGRHNSTGQYLARVLNRKYRVLWWDSLGLRRPRLTPSDIGRVGVKLMKFARGINVPDFEPDSDRPEVVTPIVVPYHGPAWVGRVNAGIVRALAKKRGAFPPDVLMAACPGAADVMRLTPAALKVYYCADEYSALPGMDSELVRRLESRLLDSVDLVVTSSRTLFETKSRLHGNVRYLPHGVDYDLFSQALESGEKPAELASVDRPIVGFVGLMDNYTDLELLDRLAASIPEAAFVFIGPSRLQRPPRGENVYCLGPKPHEALFRYLAHFDVGIVPYRPGSFAEHANPTKLREYLAAGVPVVSVPVPEARGISPHVTFAEDRNRFVEAVRERLEESSDQDRMEISRSVAEQSWLCRGDALLRMLAEALEEPSAPHMPAKIAKTG